MYLLYQRSYRHYCPTISGGGNQLYHGSPYKVSLLKPNKPRSHDEDPFTHTEGVFFTTNKKDAMIYAVARDKDRNNRGWAVFNEKLYIKDKLKGIFNFNKEGYLYVINKKDHKCLKSSLKYPNEYVITCSVKPDKIITVTYDDIKDDIIYIDEDGKKELEMRMRNLQYVTDLASKKKMIYWDKLAGPYFNNGMYLVDLMFLYINNHNITSKKFLVSRFLKYLRTKGWGVEYGKERYSAMDVINNSKGYGQNKDYDKIMKADLRYPIILDEKLNIVDGIHRLAKAYVLDKKYIRAYVFNKELMDKFKVGSGKSFKSDHNYYKSLTKKKIEQLYKDRFNSPIV